MAFRYASNEANGRKAGLVEVTGRIVRTTQKAVLLDDGRTSQWLPKSKLVIEPGRDGTTAVAMPDWLAKEKRYV